MPGVLANLSMEQSALRARHGNRLSMLSQNEIEWLSSCLVIPAGLPGDGLIREHL